MDKFTFCGHDMVVMKEDEFKEMLIDANARGYITGYSAGLIKGYDLGMKV